MVGRGWCGWVLVIGVACGGADGSATQTSDASSSSSSGIGGSSSSGADDDATSSSDAPSTSSESSGKGGSSSSTGDATSCDCAADEICIEQNTDGCFDPHHPSLSCAPLPEGCTADAECGTECAWEICGGPDCGGPDGEVCSHPSPGYVCGGFTSNCNLFTQDCDEMSRCVSWDGDNGGEYDRTRCTTIEARPAQLGEPCVSENSHLSGVDNCAAGTMCLSDDPTETDGICRAACTGNPFDAACEDPEMQCVVDEWFFAWCLPA